MLAWSLESGVHSVLVTGAGGFVGSACVRALSQHPAFSVTAAVHDTQPMMPPGVEVRRAGSLGQGTWDEVVRGQDFIVHAAARVHVMQDAETDPLSAYRRVNVDGTLDLARRAAAAGVRRFVFVSSIKVNGEKTAAGCAYRADDPPAPLDPYGVSKLEAERGLFELASASNMEVVVIRPPLVYGPGVRANFLQLMKLVQAGWPLPLAAVDNARSLVGIDNLVHLVRCCLVHPRAANQVFLASDGEDLSTPALIRRLARGLGRPPRLLSVPIPVLHWLGALAGRQAAVRRVCGSLRVDISKTRDMLDWMPPVGVDEGLRRTAEHFLESVS